MKAEKPLFLPSAWSRRYRLIINEAAQRHFFGLQNLKLIQVNSDTEVLACRFRTRWNSSSNIAAGQLVDEEEKLDTLNVPYDAASKEEVQQQIVQSEGSFMVEHIETIALGVSGISPAEADPWTRGKKLAKNGRPFMGSVNQHQPGRHYGLAL